MCQKICWSFFETNQVSGLNFKSFTFALCPDLRTFMLHITALDDYLTRGNQNIALSQAYVTFVVGKI